MEKAETYWTREIIFDNRWPAKRGEIRFVHFHQGVGTVADITPPEHTGYLGTEIKEKNVIIDQPHWTTEIKVQCPKCKKILTEEDVAQMELWVAATNPRNLFWD